MPAGSRVDRLSRAELLDRRAHALGARGAGRAGLCLFLERRADRATTIMAGREAPRFAWRPVAGRGADRAAGHHRRARRAAARGRRRRLLPAAALRASRAGRSRGSTARRTARRSSISIPGRSIPASRASPDAPLKSRLRHYTKLSVMRPKLLKLLKAHEWGRTDEVVARRAGAAAMNAPAPGLTARASAPPISRSGRGARIDAFVAEHPDGAHLPPPAMEPGGRARLRPARALSGRRARRRAGRLPAAHRDPLAPVRQRAGLGRLRHRRRHPRRRRGGRRGAAPRPAWALAERLGCPTVELRGGPLPDGLDAQRRRLCRLRHARCPPDDEAHARVDPAPPARRGPHGPCDFGLEIRVGTGAARPRRALSASMPKASATSARRSSRARLFEAVLDEFGEDADIVDRLEGRPPARRRAQLLLQGRLSSLIWGGGTARRGDWRANELIYFELMRHAVARGCTRFDFGRSKVGTGACAFKRNWGFEPRAAASMRSAPPTARRRARSIRSSPKYRLQVAAWQKLPLWLANRLGPSDRAGARLMADILFLAHRIPFPPDRGDKIRSWHVLQASRPARRGSISPASPTTRPTPPISPALREALGGRLGEAHVEVRRPAQGARPARAR